MSHKITILKPSTGTGINLSELWSYRELFLFFGLRDIRLRYRHPAIAIFWAIIPPLVMSSVFNLSFGKVIQITPANIPYVLFAYLGLVFWNYFSSVVYRSSSSLLTNQALITKTYFPRIILPLSSATVGLVDFCFVFIVFLGLTHIYNIDLHLLRLLFLIPCLVITLLFSMALGMLFSALNIIYKDTRELLPLLTSLLFFLTPVIYPVKLVSGYYYPLLYLNPMMGVIDTARTSMFESSSINVQGMLISFTSAFIFFLIALIYFKKVESELVDII